MKKAVLRSIKPYWLYLILIKKKTVEIGKNKPTGEDWTRKVYLYCSKDMRSFKRIPEKDREWMRRFLGSVVCEFVCDCIISHCETANADIAEQQGFIKREKLLQYANGKELYGWHISDLVVYDNPKTLGSFLKPCKRDFDVKQCISCKNLDYNDLGFEACDRRIIRPPQSWFYVEELGE